MKTAGCILIVIAALMSGAESLRRDRERAETLRSLTSSLTSLRAEIVSGFASTNEALAAVSGTLKGRTAEFYARVAERMRGLGERSFFDIWSEAVKESLGVLSEDELEAIEEVGSGLGRYDRGTVAAILDRAEKRLQVSYDLFEAKRRKEGKLRFLLPLSAAILTIVIIL